MIPLFPAPSDSAARARKFELLSTAVSTAHRHFFRRLNVIAHRPGAKRVWLTIAKNGGEDWFFLNTSLAMTEPAQRGLDFIAGKLQKDHGNEAETVPLP